MGNHQLTMRTRLPLSTAMKLIRHPPTNEQVTAANTQRVTRSGACGTLTIALLSLIPSDFSRLPLPSGTPPRPSSFGLLAAACARGLRSTCYLASSKAVASHLPAQTRFLPETGQRSQNAVTHTSYPPLDRHMPLAAAHQKKPKPNPSAFDALFLLSPTLAYQEIPGRPAAPSFFYRKP